MDKCFSVDLKDLGLIPSHGDFFHLNFFQRGNEPNGEQQQGQQQQELKEFLGLWPMAADNNVSFSIEYHRLGSILRGLRKHLLV